MKVLIVDDNDGTRSMIKVILRQTGHTVVGEAADGEAGLKAFSELRPDVVLLDVIMPGRSGLEVLADIRKLDPAAKVVMVTAVDQDSVNSDLLSLGATAIIYKPFSYGDFEKTFKKIA
jgi:two-component system chemotaxis response regulator CheY